MLYIYILIFFIFFIAFRPKKGEEPALSKKETTILKGLMAMCVILHHLGQNVDLGCYFFERINKNLGDIAVGVFFMLSAFGIITQYLKNPDKYPLRLLLTKIPALYLLQVITNLIYLLIFNPSLPLDTSLIHVFNLDIFFGIGRINPYSWFITSILFVYIIMAVVLLVASKVKNKKLFIGIGLTTILLIVWIAGRLSLDPLYVRSLPCHLIGVWYALYYDKINTWLQNKKIFTISLTTTTSLLILALIIMGIFHAEEAMLFCALICTLIIILTQKLTLKSKVFSFLGEISLEIYLLQYIAFSFISPQSIEFIWALTIIGTTVVLAYFYHEIYKFTSKGITKLKTTIRKSKPPENKKTTE